jgi:hypothetical protein
MSKPHELDGGYTASELRAKFLRDAEPVLRYVVGKAKGVRHPDIPEISVDQEHVSRVWKTLEPMLIAASDMQKVEVRTTAGIVDAVCRGKISLADAKELMLIMKSQFEMDKLPELISQLTDLTSN